MSFFDFCLTEARHALACERAELAATTAAALARLDLLDRLLAPGARPLCHSVQNQFSSFLNAGCIPRIGSRRHVSRLLTAGG